MPKWALWIDDRGATIPVKDQAARRWVYRVWADLQIAVNLCVQMGANP